jgi:hypothetical protein
MRAQKRNLMNLSAQHLFLWASAQWALFACPWNEGGCRRLNTLMFPGTAMGSFFSQGQGSVLCSGFSQDHEKPTRARKGEKIKKEGPIGKIFPRQFFPGGRTVRWRVSGRQRCPGMPSCAQTMPRARRGRVRIPGRIPGVWGQRCREERKFNTTKDLRNRHTTRSCTL